MAGSSGRPPSEFEQGHDAGRQDQTLADHAEHLKRINGSIDRTGDELEELRAEVRSLREDEDRRAEALAEKEEDRAEELARRARNFRWLVGAGLAALTLVSGLRGSPI